MRAQLLMTIATAWVLAGLGVRGADARPQSGGEAYENMPAIAPIGVRPGRYLDVPDGAKGPPIDPAKGYRVQDLGQGLHMITDNAYQSMFLVYEDGVVVVDAPPTYAPHIMQAIREITGKPMTHLIYSHAHADHIGGAAALGSHPIIIAHEETKRLLARTNDPHRPLPSVTFKDRYTLKVGSKVLELSYRGVAHEPGNIFIYAPAQRTLMVVDVVLPGWMPFKRFSYAQDIPGYFAQVAEIEALPWTTLVGGHVARTGTHADVQTQLEFMSDLKAEVQKALASIKPAGQLDPLDAGNPWAYAGNYIDRIAIQCVNGLQDKWSKRLGGYDAFIWDQCYAMEQSLTMD
ncbi:MBL fold metallo-hydrolase [Sphingomonas sp. PB4P5]|uniref:MBL fold metallo-hydrolase n=1 Tax=Parasphingomonas puruogangriensis TaxID=3096155 RepID=UPI002FC75C02